MRETGNGTKKSRTLQELNLKDDFLFAKVMTDEEICKEVLEKILRINIAKIEILQSQKAIDLALQNRGIRLDIYVEDENGAFDPRRGYKIKRYSGKKSTEESGAGEK